MIPLQPKPPFPPPHRRRGMTLTVFLLAAAILLILLATLYYVRSQHLKVVNLSAEAYQAQNIAEGGLHCLLSELRFNDDYATTNLKMTNPSGMSWDWGWGEGGEWMPSLPEYGVSLGRLPNEFEAKIQTANGSKLYSGNFPDPNIDGFFLAKFSTFAADTKTGETKIKTLRENNLYAYGEVVSHLRNTNTYLKLNAIFSRRSPLEENLFYDGEVLDFAFASNRGQKAPVANTRMYGHKFINFTRHDPEDSGTWFKRMEKIETPGWIRIQEGEKFDLDTINPKPGQTGETDLKIDSRDLEKFYDFDGMVLDRDHNAHSQIIPGLNPEYFFNIIKRKVVLVKSNPSPGKNHLLVPESKWRFPGKPNEIVYDLNFGRWDSADDPVWGPLEHDGDDTLGNSPPPKDQYKFPNWGKLVIVTDLPLRVWGNPDRPVTIFSSKDIFLSGDFNQRPWFNGIPVKVQIYPGGATDNQKKGFIDYQSNRSDIPMGTGNWRYGCAVMSGSRVWFNYTQPELFLKNEYIPFLEFLLASFLRGENEKGDADSYFDFSNNSAGLQERRHYVAERTAKTSITWNDGQGSLWHPSDFPYIQKLKELPSWMDIPGQVGIVGWFVKFCRQRLKITSPLLIADLGMMLWTTCKIGVLPAKARLSNSQLLPGIIDKIYKEWWKKSQKAQTPGESPFHAFASDLFHLSLLQSDDMLFAPEMTVNAIVVSSARRFQKWDWGRYREKIYDELGNKDIPAFKTWQFLDPEKKEFLILRVFGGYIRLGAATPDYFNRGDYFTRKGVLRRFVYANNGQDEGDPSAAPRLPHAWNILSLRHEKISKKEFDEFK